MLNIFLLTLLTLLHVHYDANLLNQSDLVKQQMVENLLADYQPAYRIYKVLPPIKNSLSVAPNINISAQSGVAIDFMSNKVLWQRNPAQKSSIASLTKIMTALVFLDTNPDLDKEFIISKEEEKETEGATLRLKSGEKLKVKDLFYTSLVASANNATKALVRSTGLSEQEFVQKMNEKAYQLGLKNTNYVGVTGLDPGNQSTVLDIAKLASYAFENTLIKEALLTREYDFETTGSKIIHHIKNTNELLFDTSLNLAGAKTGYLDEAGYTYVSEMEKNGHKIMIVLFRSESSQARFQEAKVLANWVFNNYRWF